MANSRVVGYSKVGRNGILGKCSDDSVCPSAPWFESAELLVIGRLEAGRLFEDIQDRSRTIDSVTLRIAYLFYDTRAF